MIDETGQISDMEAIRELNETALHECEERHYEALETVILSLYNVRSSLKCYTDI